MRQQSLFEKNNYNDYKPTPLTELYIPARLPPEWLAEIMAGIAERLEKQIMELTEEQLDVVCDYAATTYDSLKYMVVFNESDEVSE